MNLIEAFGIQQGDLISIVGGGGKSSLLFRLERQWAGNIVVTTTTRIFAALIARARAHVTLDLLEQLGEQLAINRSCLVIGEAIGEKAQGVPIEFPGELLARQDVDVVAVEADGSRMRPVKAPAAHEPVIAPETTVGVIVMGMDALEGRLEEVAHRPKIITTLTNTQLHQPLTPTTLTTLLTHPQGGLKSMPTNARIIVCLNKVDTEQRQESASMIAQHLLATSKIERVVLTKLQPDVEVVAVYPSA